MKQTTTAIRTNTPTHTAAIIIVILAPASTDSTTGTSGGVGVIILVFISISLADNVLLDALDKIEFSVSIDVLDSTALLSAKLLDVIVYET